MDAVLVSIVDPSQKEGRLWVLHSLTILSCVLLCQLLWPQNSACTRQVIFCRVCLCPWGWTRTKRGKWKAH